MLRVLVIIGLVSFLFGCGTTPTHAKTGKKDQPCYFYQAKPKVQKSQTSTVQKATTVTTKKPAKIK